MRKKRLFLSDGTTYTKTGLKIQKEYINLTKKLMTKHKTVDLHDFMYLANNGISWQYTMIILEEKCKKKTNKNRRKQ